MSSRSAASLPSALESRVMDIVRRRGSATADHVRQELGGRLSNATVRTLLRRVEAKGLLSHHLDGRAFVYTPKVERQAVAGGLLRRVIDRFYGGSAEQLVLGLLDGKLIDRRKLDRITQKVAAASRAARKSRERSG